MAFPPQDVTAKGTPKPYTPPEGAGAILSLAQPLPPQPGSQTQLPDDEHTPRSEQSASVAQRARAATSDSDVATRCLNHQEHILGGVYYSS
jgi:hypothetical protein